MEQEKKETLEFGSVRELKEYLNNCDEDTLVSFVIVMEDGGIIMDGAPDKVFTQAEKLWEAGLDVPQTTELLWRLRAAGLDVPLDVFDPKECAKVIKNALAERGRY